MVPRPRGKAGGSLGKLRGGILIRGKEFPANVGEKGFKLNLKDRRLADWTVNGRPDGRPRWDGSVHGDFAARIRLMGTADGIFCGGKTNILALACKTVWLAKRWLRVSSITLDAQECNHVAGVGDSEVRMWDDNNRRRQVGAD